MWSSGSDCGAWSLNVDGASSSRYRIVGGRLLYVQALKSAEVLRVLKSILFEPLLILAFWGIEMYSYRVLRSLKNSVYILILT